MPRKLPTLRGKRPTHHVLTIIRDEGPKHFGREVEVGYAWFGTEAVNTAVYLDRSCRNFSGWLHFERMEEPARPEDEQIAAQDTCELD